MFLDRILASGSRRVEARQRERPRRDVERAALEAEPPRGFAPALLAAPAGIGLIAELKKASPSAGVLRADFDVPTLAADYARGGASCLSVLTEPDHFQGDLVHLSQAAGAGLPRLQKDFLLSEYQVLEGRASGADAVLLIAEAIDMRRAQDLCRLALDLGMDVLFEAYEPANVRRVAGLAERDPERVLVGINNRDLRTFEVSLEVSLRALGELPHDLVLVSESGIRTPDDVWRLREAGARGVLVGETLLRAPDVERAVVELLSGVARDPRPAAETPRRASAPGPRGAPRSPSTDGLPGGGT